MILKLPITVDASVLKLAFEVAEKSGAELRIETFFRIRHDAEFSIDCDTEREVRDYARVFIPSLKKAHDEPVAVPAVAAPSEDGKAPQFAPSSDLEALWT